jgi:hypothetical protein
MYDLSYVTCGQWEALRWMSAGGGEAATLEWWNLGWETFDGMLLISSRCAGTKQLVTIHVSACTYAGRLVNHAFCMRLTQFEQLICISRSRINDPEDTLVWSLGWILLVRVFAFAMAGGARWQLDHGWRALAQRFLLSPAGQLWRQCANLVCTWAMPETCLQFLGFQKPSEQMANTALQSYLLESIMSSSLRASSRVSNLDMQHINIIKAHPEIKAQWYFTS